MSGQSLFRTNPNKDFLRSSYDRGLVESWYQRRGDSLHYLGLPGPEMLDIVEWQEYIGRFSTIERQESAQHRLFLRVHVRDLEHRLHSLYGEFDDILLTGRDLYGHAPRWPYDLINLDYFGGLLYQDMARPRALRKLIENQGNYERSFLLLITQDLREIDPVGEKHAFLADLERTLVRDFSVEKEARAFIAAYRDEATPDAARQALYVNLFLRDAGEMARFRVRTRPAIVYRGTGGSSMIHYATEFHFHRAEYRVVSDQSLADLLNLGVLELREGELTRVIPPAVFGRS